MDIIELKSLRIDNWVQIDGNPYQVDAIIRTDSVAGFELYVKGIDYDYAIHSEPIVLTEEWLEKLGFEETTSGCYMCDKDAHLWYFINEKYFECGDFSAPCSFVHQLQNWYFMLTDGSELELKQLV
jgi:hypothetical protein